MNRLDRDDDDGAEQMLGCLALLIVFTPILLVWFLLFGAR